MASYGTAAAGRGNPAEDVESQPLLNEEVKPHMVFSRQT